MKREGRRSRSIVQRTRKSRGKEGIDVHIHFDELNELLTNYYRWGIFTRPRGPSFSAIERRHVRTGSSYKPKEEIQRVLTWPCHVVHSGGKICGSKGKRRRIPDPANFAHFFFFFLSFSFFNYQRADHCPLRFNWIPLHRLYEFIWIYDAFYSIHVWSMEGGESPVSFHAINYWNWNYRLSR